jgi:transposase
MFKDSDALIDALAETSPWTAEQIEVHTEPQHLFGYTGDRRTQKAHIIIRRKHVGRSSNDIGFIRKEDSTYEAIISEYDSSKYGSKFMGQLKGSYAFHKLRREQESRGRKVSRTRCPNGRQRVEITGYR